jgi:exosortase/archaeosortase family protein
MRSRRERVVLGMIFIVGSTALGYVLLQTRARHLEARACVFVLWHLGVRHISVIDQTSILIRPHNTFAFIATITPSCSALSSVLVLVCLGSLLPQRRRGTRVLAILAGVAVVTIGNLVRIGSAIAVGSRFGPSAQVLFHDWVGAIFAFAYTLCGFILMLFIHLPPRDEVPDVRLA